MLLWVISKLQHIPNRIIMIFAFGLNFVIEIGINSNRGKS